MQSLRNFCSGFNHFSAVVVPFYYIMMLCCVEPSGREKRVVVVVESRPSVIFSQENLNSLLLSPIT